MLLYSSLMGERLNKYFKEKLWPWKGYKLNQEYLILSIFSGQCDRHNNQHFENEKSKTNKTWKYRERLSQKIYKSTFYSRSTKQKYVIFCLQEFPIANASCWCEIRDCIFRVIPAPHFAMTKFLAFYIFCIVSLLFIIIFLFINVIF